MNPEKTSSICTAVDSRILANLMRYEEFPKSRNTFVGKMVSKCVQHRKNSDITVEFDRIWRQIIKETLICTATMFLAFIAAMKLPVESVAMIKGTMSLIILSYFVLGIILAAITFLDRRLYDDQLQFILETINNFDRFLMPVDVFGYGNCCSRARNRIEAMMFELICAKKALPEPSKRAFANFIQQMYESTIKHRFALASACFGRDFHHGKTYEQVFLRVRRQFATIAFRLSDDIRLAKQEYRELELRHRAE